MNTSDKIIKFYDNLRKVVTKNNIAVLDPYTNSSVKKIYRNFYNKYFYDTKKRIILFGINPGRLGGGITGIPFTDPYNLKVKCGINSDFNMKKELSSKFIYEMIEGYGGTKMFYKKFFISSICPYGFTFNGKNLNYYDDNDLFNKWKNQIVKWIRFQIENIGSNKICVIIGKGKNQKFFEILNKSINSLMKLLHYPIQDGFCSTDPKKKIYILKIILKH